MRSLNKHIVVCIIGKSWSKKVEYVACSPCQGEVEGEMPHMTWFWAKILFFFWNSGGPRSSCLLQALFLLIWQYVRPSNISTFSLPECKRKQADEGGARRVTWAELPHIRHKVVWVQTSRNLKMSLDHLAKRGWAIVFSSLVDHLDILCFIFWDYFLFVGDTLASRWAVIYIVCVVQLSQIQMMMGRQTRGDSEKSSKPTIPPCTVIIVHTHRGSCNQISAKDLDDRETPRAE